ncbi:MAG: hypothetical protein PHH08_00350 [Candidatus ainarchaeum sp.]|nr:hypothetical protein [Candidatus ainarchaeum sp.]
MAFDLFELHDSTEDSNNRRLLRVYSVLSKFNAKAIPAQAEQAARINLFLKSVNKKLNKNIGFYWKEMWIQSLGCSFAKGCYKDWFRGKTSIPLVAINNLRLFGFQEDIEELIADCKFFCSTTGPVFNLPNELNEDLAYLLGAILGDGHICKQGYAVRFKVIEKSLAEKFRQKMSKVFFHEIRMKERTESGRQTQFCVDYGDKPIVRVFTKILKVPVGKIQHNSNPKNSF